MYPGTCSECYSKVYNTSEDSQKKKRSRSKHWNYFKTFDRMTKQILLIVLYILVLSDYA